MPVSYKKKVHELSEILRISEDIFKPVKTFSGGMKRKLEILRGLMHRPKILFLDEPTSGLDPESRRNLWMYLQNVRRTSKITIFLTTHCLDEAEVSDKICIIQKGKIITNGSPSQIKNSIIKDYLRVNSQNPKKLEQELKKKKISFQKEKDFIIPIQNKTTQKIIQLIKTPLTTLIVHEPTLEDAYLEIIEPKRNSPKL
ncbi:hypothetical protein A2690_02120 [Candidatus Roizmanbacteria bacterium RIFCSPHIGHO2_01_FULL_39_12b]|uniref:ABC transporter domain-containing protein n=1 Tax=Candidatus Roizmanbacteria bacterium RIFCSPHIGHO2_01_FULL_39_12b TaxID=1802030 RepID=A0A1F7GE49_9BACT|nr:MAG: hypothetical protein A2690_02120 [Candidatus Roizmanbacteria bacterium RIFCSPHIGHO2_01_FULL_39_12b]OGK46324.1 MAG: hypothetical protein A3B46_00090 [Candidatus Roizmanbacteria bacterium RIFCSPLOWO2_01_FULL_39_19]